MMLKKLCISLCLFALISSVSAGTIVQHSGMLCAKPLNPWQLLNALQLSLKSRVPEQFACLFHLAVNIEFDKTTWLLQKSQFAEAIPELDKSGFVAFLESADKENTIIDEKNGSMLIRNRLLIKYGNSANSGVYKVNEVDDLQEPNDFKYSGIHSEREFQAWYLRLQQAIGSKDKVAVANMACYPLGIAVFDVDYNEHDFTVHNVRQFVQRYDEIITPHTRQVVLQSHWPNLFNNSDGITLGQGDIQIISNGQSECIESVANGPGVKKLDAQAKAAATVKNNSSTPDPRP